MRYLISLGVMVALSGCVPLRTYYQPGASVERLKSEQLACEVQALKDAPVVTQTRVTPPRYVGPRTYCDSNSACVTKGGFWISGDVYTVDVNADLRRRVEIQCMAKRGFQPASIPACPPDVARSAPAGATSVLPPLSEKSCVIRNRDGSFQIVTRS